MPWSIKKIDSKFCVVKEGESKPIKGGCHANRAEAVDHLQALYANEAMSSIAQAFEVEESDSAEADLDLDYLVASFTITERNWKGPIAFENVATGDKRKFSSDAITWDTLPLPLLFQRVSGEGHSGSVIIGRVDELAKQDDTIYGKGVILEGIPEADEFLALLEHGAAGGVSVDGDSAQYQVEEVEEGGQKSVQFTSMRVRGLTAVAIPAFSDAQIELNDEATPETELSDEAVEAAIEDIELGEEEAESELSAQEIEELAKKRKKRKKRAMTWKYAVEAGIVASAAPVKPPLEWFVNPLLDGPTALTVTSDGAVFGHIALFGTCHIGMPKCTKPPKGGTYNYFHTGEVETDDGTNVAVGHLTFDTGHASVYDNAFSAASHYDNTGYVGADVVCGEDKFGIWVAGALRPELTEEQVRKFRAAPISGDWRKIGNKMELVAALSVNTPGFPVPRARALVASAAGGEMEPETVITYSEDTLFTDQNERREFRTFLADKVREVFADSPCKTEADGSCYPASDYAYVPDREHSSTWKLRLTATPGGSPDRAIVGAALAALGKGFRGNKVQIPAEDLPAVKRKVKAAWLEANKSKDSSDVPSVVATAETVTFNLNNLESAETNIDDAIDALDQDSPDISSALSNARAAKKSLDKAADNYGGSSGDSSGGGHSSGGGGSSGGYAAETVTFNLKYTKSALGHVSDAIDYLEEDEPNVDAALNELEDAADAIDEAIDNYDSNGPSPRIPFPIRIGVIPGGPPGPPGPPGPGMTAETVEFTDLSAVTEEFASCAAASRRVRKARRALRKAIRAYRTCSGNVIIVHTPPASGMAGDTIEMVSLEMVEFAGAWEVVNWGGATPYCAKPIGLRGGNGSSDALSEPLKCFKTEAEALDYINGLAAPSAEWLEAHKPLDEKKAEEDAKKKKSAIAKKASSY